MMTLLLGSVEVACAQAVTVHGIPFQVDEISDVDDESVRVTLFQEETIVERSQVNEFVAQSYFDSQHKDVLKPDQLVDFVREAVRDGDTDLALKGFDAYLRHSKVDKNEIQKLIGELASDKKGVEFFRLLLPYSREIRAYPEAVAAVVFYAGLSDTTWVRKHAIKYVYLNGQELRAFIDTHFFKALGEQDGKRAQQILKFEETLFGKDDPRHVKRRQLSNKIKKSLASIESGDLAGLLPLIDLSGQNPRLEKVLPPMILEIIHREARKAINAGKAERALRALVHVDLNWRTPTTHMLVVDALKHLSPDHAISLSEAGINNFLQALAHRDPLIKSAYIQYLELEIRSLLRHGRAKDAGSALANLLYLRPDPNQANDRIRVEQSIVYAVQDMTPAARDVLAEVKTGLTWGERIRILLAGIYISPYMIVVVLLCPFILYAVISRLVRLNAPRVKTYDMGAGIPSNGGQYSVSTGSSSTYFTDDDDDEMPVFSRKMGGRLDPREEEYKGCLQVFNLQAGATLRNIKSAYRNAVKELHPDLNPNVTPEQTERFLELTRKYEQLMQLHRELGFTK